MSGATQYRAGLRAYRLGYVELTRAPPAADVQPKTEANTPAGVFVGIVGTTLFFFDPRYFDVDAKKTLKLGTLNEDPSVLTAQNFRSAVSGSGGDALNPQIATKNLFFAPSLGLVVEEAMRREYEIQPLASGIAIYADALRFNAPPIAVVFARAAKEANEPQKRHSAWVTPTGELHYPEGYETPAQLAARTAAARKASRVRQQAAVAMGADQWQVEEDAEAIGLTPTGLVNLRTYWATPKDYGEVMGGWGLKGPVTETALAGALAFLARGVTTVVFGRTADAHNARHIVERIAAFQFEVESEREQQWAKIEEVDARLRAEGLDTAENWMYRHPLTLGSDHMMITALNHMTESQEAQGKEQRASKARQTAAWEARKLAFAPPPPKPPEEQAVHSISEFVTAPEDKEKAEAAGRDHYKAYYRGTTGRGAYLTKATPILDALPEATLRAMLRTLGDGGLRPELQQWLHRILERYTGRARWMRKENLQREDGQDKHATIGTRVVSRKQREAYHGNQEAIPAGWHGIVEASGTHNSRAKDAVGTMSALLVRFDPEIPREVVPEEPKAKPAKASSGTSRLGVALMEEPWNQEIAWVIDAADRDGKPTERHWQPKGSYYDRIVVMDSRRDASSHPRGRYKVGWVVGDSRGGKKGDVSVELSGGMGFNTLEEVRNYLKEHWELNRKGGRIP